MPLEEAGITLDPYNARIHTPRSIGLIEDSMQMDGAGRSILADQHGVTIAGAGAWEAATQRLSHTPPWCRPTERHQMIRRAGSFGPTC